MKNRFLQLFLLVIGMNALEAQTTYTDDFDAYTPGTTIVTNNPTYWRTWTSTSGGAADDAFITDEAAASGGNSIKIEAKSTSGGPEDLLLKLGNNVSKGTVSTSWNMLVANGKTAYFNFQSASTPGTGWAMDFYFNADGTIDVVANSKAFSNRLSFPVGKWFNFAVQIDVSNNLWQVSIDGACKAVFRSALTTVASVDFFANAGNKYYIDDVSFTTDVADIKTFEGVEAGLLNLTVTEGKQIAGTTVKTAVTLYNTGKDTITSIDFDVTSAAGTQSLSTSDLSLAPKRSVVIDIPADIALIDGDNNMTLTLTRINGQEDELSCNNTLESSTYAVAPAKHRKVVLEEGTGTWCGWCPRGAVFLDAISPLYDDYFIPIAVHNADVMTVTAYDNAITSFPGFTGFPGMVVDRREVTDPSAALLPGLNYLREEPDATLLIGATEPDENGKMDISVSLDYLKSVPGGYSMYLTVVENEVRGTGSQYNQSNYYAGGASGPMGGYENLPATVPAAQMVYDHVARTFDYTVKNMEEASEGDKLIRNYSVTLNSAWVKEKIKIVAVLLNDDGAVSNANDATIEDAVANGYVTASTDKVLVNAKMSVYPNPARETTTIDIELDRPTHVSASVLDVQGRVVFQKDFGMQQGRALMPASLKGIAPGAYTVLVRTDEGIATKKLVIQ